MFFMSNVSLTIISTVAQGHAEYSEHELSYFCLAYHNEEFLFRCCHITFLAHWQLLLYHYSFEVQRKNLWRKSCEAMCANIHERVYRNANFLFLLSSHLSRES